MIFHSRVLATHQNSRISVDMHMKIAPVGVQVLDVSSFDLLKVLGFGDYLATTIYESEVIGVDSFEDGYVAVPESLIFLAFDLEDLGFRSCTRLVRDGSLRSSESH